MLNYLQAQEILKTNARSFGKETIGLEDAYGRVLAETILADRDYPPFNRSTVDGYAIRHEDFERGIRRFRIVETLYAGSEATVAIYSGECYKIMTGAAVPAGADAVIKREDTDEATPPGYDQHGAGAGVDIVVQVAVCRTFQHIARKGEDMRSGDAAISSACICGAAAIGLLASLGKKEIMVERLPRVALFTTGNEVLPVEAKVSPVQIRNSNRWIIQSLLRPWGIGPEICEHIRDDRALMVHAVEKELKGPADLFIFSGGVSAGDADHVPGVLEELGVKKLFHKLSIRPGKPIWCGVLPGGGLAFGLPGNPFSCMVTFHLFIDYYLRACFGLPAPVTMRLPLQEGRIKKTSLDEFFPVMLNGEQGSLSSVPINSSGDIRLGLQANALALHPAEAPDIVPGQPTLCYGPRW
jgi:molybdopterin molybdotransferase